MSDRLIEMELGDIVITAPEILKGKKLGDVISIANMEEITAIVDKYADKFAAQELRKVPQVDVDLEAYLWKRIDQLESRS